MAHSISFQLHFLINSPKILFIAILILVCACKSPGPSFIGPLPFDSKSKWKQVSDYESLMKLDPTGSNPNNLLRLNRALDFVRYYSNEDQFLIAYDDLNVNPQMTIFDGSAELLGIYLITGDESSGCLMDLMPGNPIPNEEEDDDDVVEGKDDDVPVERPEREIEVDPGIDMESDVGEQEAERNADKFNGKRCGTISTIHSLIKLGWIEESDAIEGEYLNPEFVVSFDKYLENEGGLNWDKQNEAHKDGMPEGQEFDFTDSPVSGIDSKKIAEERYTEAKDSFDKGWDCILRMEWNDTEENKRIKHAEQITKFEIKDDIVILETINALTQGKAGGEEIPSNPGTNDFMIKIPINAQQGSKKMIDWVRITCYGLKEKE